jgi:hypothetical protein
MAGWIVSLDYSNNTVLKSNIIFQFLSISTTVFPAATTADTYVIRITASSQFLSWSSNNCLTCSNNSSNLCHTRNSNITVSVLEQQQLSYPQQQQQQPMSYA